MNRFENFSVNYSIALSVAGSTIEVFSVNTFLPFSGAVQVNEFSGVVFHGNRLKQKVGKSFNIN